VSSSQDHSHNRFATTNWSLVLQSATSGDASHALDGLIERCWYPVYSYTRRCGHAPVIALGITLAFLSSFKSDLRDGRTPGHVGQFRRFLLERLNDFLGSDWSATVDDSAPDLVAPVDLEARYARDNVAATSPEQAYQRSFALDVLARALERLRLEAHRGGHAAMYAALETYLVHDPGPGEYEAHARTLKTRPLALIVALKRLRQRLRELAGEELADTVTSTDELLAEQAALHATLAAGRSPR
jgi:hypothetical protein